MKYENELYEIFLHNEGDIQGEEDCTIINKESGEKITINLWDYDSLYKIPKVFEILYQEICKSQSIYSVWEIFCNLNLERNYRVLDIGAGAGLSGREIKKSQRVKVLDGLDILESAKEACLRDYDSVYGSYFVCSLVDLDYDLAVKLKKNDYNCITVVSASGGSDEDQNMHDVELEEYKKLLHILKKGGYIVFNIREDEIKGQTLIREFLEEHCEMVHKERYLHRYLTNGQEVYYNTFVFKKVEEYIDWEQIPTMISHEVKRAKNMIEEENYYLSIIQLKDAYEVLIKTVCLTAITVCDESLPDLFDVHNRYWNEYYNKNKNNDIKIKYLSDLLVEKKVEFDTSKVNKLNDYDDSEINDFLVFRRVITFMMSKSLSLGDWRNDILSDVANLRRLPKALKILIKELKEYLDDLERKKFKLVNWRNKEIGHGALKLNLFDDDISNLKRICSLLVEFVANQSNELYELNYVCKEIYEENDYNMGLVLNGPDVVSFISEMVKTSYLELCCTKEYRTELNPLIYVFSGGVYLFDSYYVWKGTAFAIDYPNGIVNSCHEKTKKWINDIGSKIGYRRDMMYESLHSKLISKETQEFMKNLGFTSNYMKPQYIVERVDRFLYTKPKGILMLQMDRGMGKTVFAKALDQTFDIQNIYGFADDEIYVRTIFLNGYTCNTRNLFFQALSEHFLDGSFTREIKLKNYSKSEDPNEYREFIAEYLNKISKEVEELKNKKLILVIDGLDELAEPSVLESIPTKEMLEENVYIILTARNLEDVEYDSDNNIFMYIEMLKRKCGIDENDVVSFKLESDEYKAFVYEYLEFVGFDRNQIKNITLSANNRMVFLSIYSQIANKNDYDTLILEENILESYIQELCTKVIGTFSVGNVRYYKVVVEIVSLLALVGEPLNIYEMKYMLRQYCNDYELIGILYDISPIIRIDRTNDRGNIYSLSHNIIHRQARKKYRNEILVLKNSLTSMMMELSEDELELLLKKANMKINDKDAKSVIDNASGLILLFSSVDVFDGGIEYNEALIKKLSICAKFVDDLKDLLDDYLYLDRRRKSLYELILDYIRKNFESNHSEVFYRIIWQYAIYLRESYAGDNVINAKNLLKNLLNKVDKNKNESLYYQILNSYGMTLRRLRKYELSIECFVDAEKYYEERYLKKELNVDEIMIYAQIKTNKAIDIRNQFYSKSEIEVLKQMINVFDETIKLKEEVHSHCLLIGEGGTLPQSIHSKGLAVFAKAVYHISSKYDIEQSDRIYKNMLVLMDCLKKIELDKDDLIYIKEAVTVYKNSINKFNEVVEKGYRFKDLNLAHCYLHLGDALWLSGNLDKAERNYRKSIEIYKGHIKRGNNTAKLLSMHAYLHIVIIGRALQNHNDYTDELKSYILATYKKYSELLMWGEYRVYLMDLFKDDESIRECLLEG